MKWSLSDQKENNNILPKFGTFHAILLAWLNYESMKIILFHIISQITIMIQIGRYKSELCFPLYFDTNSFWLIVLFVVKETMSLKICWEKMLFWIVMPGTMAE